ncbi:MAG: hypothetical protein RLY69_730 [Verrucomicrobiota bacterium]
MPTPMRFALMLLLIPSCTPYEARPEIKSKQPQASPQTVIAPTPTETPKSWANHNPPEAPQLVSRSLTEFNLEGVAFDSRTHRLRVIDQASGPGTTFTDASQVGSSHHALAAINAGFFTPAGEPLGLLVSNGKASGSWNSSTSIGSAVWQESNSGNSNISRRHETQPSLMKQTREALQSGPMLVDHGQAVGGLESNKISARSFIAWDGDTRWFIGRTSPCALNALAETLASSNHCGWKIHRAMNLDGGRSSDLWISSRISGGPLHSRPPWNKPVRNFLILVPR